MASRINPVLSRRLSMWTTDAMVSVDFNAKTIGVVNASDEVAAGRFVADSVPLGDRAIAKDAFFPANTSLQDAASTGFQCNCCRA